MKWTCLNALGFIEPFRPRDLSYLGQLPRILNAEVPVNTPPSQLQVAKRVHALQHGDFSLACHGAAESWSASPWSIRAYCEVLDDKSYMVGTMLRVTLPANSATDELVAFSDLLASSMRIRWGALGYTYAGWDIQHNSEVRAGMFAHSRRYLGFDLPVQATLMPRWHAALRSVNWITYLGSDLVGRLAPASVSDVLNSTTLPNGSLKVVAGDGPKVGDINHLDMPRAYQDADLLMRAVRARDGFSFLDPWDELASTDWLCRFEQLVPTASS
jgi:hypothetical protein